MLTFLVAAPFCPKDMFIEQLLCARACTRWLGMQSIGAPSLLGEGFSANHDNTGFRKAEIVFCIFLYVPGLSSEPTKVVFLESAELESKIQFFE